MTKLKAYRPRTDGLDIRIFRELVQDKGNSPLVSETRKSFRAIAKELQVNEVTAWKRVRRLRHIGFLKGWRILVNPGLFGLRLFQVWIDVPSPRMKNVLLTKLAQLPSVLVIVDYVGSLLYLVLYHESQRYLKNQLRLIGPTFTTRKIRFLELPVPECQVTLSRTDLEIIKSIQKEPRKSASAIAGQLGLSTRTVTRHMEKMTEGRAFFVLPSIDPKRLEGSIATDLLVFYDSPASKNMLDGLIKTHVDEYLLRAELNSLDHGFFNLMIPNISRASEILSWVNSQHGVRESRIDLVQDRLELYESFNQQLDTLLQADCRHE